MTGTITPSDLEDRFEEAARTLRRLPNPPGSTPRGFGSSWPEYAHDPGQAYGYNEARMRVVPSAKNIEAMEACFHWLEWLDVDDRRIVWMRAEGARWKQIGQRVGVVRQTAWRRWVAALATIAKRLNREMRSLNAAGGEGKKAGLKRGGGDQQKSLALNAAGVPCENAQSLNAAGGVGAEPVEEKSASAPTAKAKP